MISGFKKVRLIWKLSKQTNLRIIAPLLTYVISYIFVSPEVVVWYKVPPLWFKMSGIAQEREKAPINVL